MKAASCVAILSSGSSTGPAAAVCNTFSFTLFSSMLAHGVCSTLKCRITMLLSEHVTQSCSTHHWSPCNNVTLTSLNSLPVKRPAAFKAGFGLAFWFEQSTPSLVTLQHTEQIIRFNQVTLRSIWPSSLRPRPLMACLTAEAASGQHVTLFIDPVRSSVTKYHVFAMAHRYGTLLVTCVGRALI